MQDPRALKRFFEEIRELPSEEELWEVPEPHKPDIPPERGTEDTWWKKHTHTAILSHMKCWIYINIRTYLSVRTTVTP